MHNVKLNFYFDYNIPCDNKPFEYTIVTNGLTDIDGGANVSFRFVGSLAVKL
jgi:hypothetical protein